MNRPSPSVLPLIALFLLIGIAPPGVQAADKRSIVAVFDIQTKRVKLTKTQKDVLTDVVAEELGAGGVFQIMPPGDVKRALLSESQETYKECYDEQCQIQLGRQLPANKLLTTSIKKVGSKCRVSASLYDLRKQTTDTTATEKVRCNEDGYAGGIEKVAAKLRAWASGKPYNDSPTARRSVSAKPRPTTRKEAKSEGFKPVPKFKKGDSKSSKGKSDNRKLTRKDLLKTMKANIKELVPCHKAHKALPNHATGTMMVIFYVESTGTVSGFEVETEQFKKTAVGNCYARKFKTFRFPAHDGKPMKIRFPFSIR